MKKTIGDYLVLLISVIGSLASILAFGYVFAPNLDKQGWVGVFFLGILTIAFIIQNFRLTSKYRTRARYSSVFEDLNLGFSEIHKLDRTKSYQEEEIIKAMISLCDSISIVFSNINGHHIGVCIKILTKKDGQPVVETLVRDKKSLSKDRKTGQKDKTIHFLERNTDFSFIYKNFDDDNIDTSNFYKTKLPSRREYRNTRLKNWPPKDVFPFLNAIIRTTQWPLKYRCTLVVPIVPLLADDQDKKTIRGFLCLDSPRGVAFNKDLDVQILKGISDGLYNKIDALLK